MANTPRSFHLPAEKYTRSGQTLLYTIQTNGIKLDDEWISFFEQHNFPVGLGTDGPKAIQDACCVKKDGDGTFRQIVRGWQRSFMLLPSCKHSLWI